MFLWLCLPSGFVIFFFFFFNDTATTEIYTLSLHDALPRSTIAAWYSGDGCESAWPTTTRERSAPSSSKMLSWSRPTADWTEWVVIARPVRRDARAAARWTRSSWAESHGL